MPQFPGCDVSNYQGQVDWPTAGRTGNTFTFIEAFDGASFHDPTFDQQWDGAGAAGLVKFAYFFWRLDQSDDGQLAAWAGLAPRVRVGDGVAGDFEYQGNDAGDHTDRIVYILQGLSRIFGVRALYYSDKQWTDLHVSHHPYLAETGLWLLQRGYRPGDAIDLPTAFASSFAAFVQDGASSLVPCTGTPPDRDWFLGPISRLHLYGKQV